MKTKITMDRNGCLFDCSDAQLHETKLASELSDKFWDHLKGAHQCLRDYRRYNDPTKPDRRVKIAILDSGADLSHPKIRHQIDEIEEYNPEPVVLHSFVDLDGSPDPLGHGTHITSTILSIASGAKLFVGRVVGKDKKVDPEALAEAINHAVETWEVDIISLSLGFPRPSEDLTKSIRNALHKEKLIFAAVSNNGGALPIGISWPARETKVFGVFSSNFHGERSEFNPNVNDDDTFSRYKFLGEAVKSAWLNCEERRMTGTSVATPIAASTAALFLEYIRGNMVATHDITSMAEIERCARMPDGMRRIFALAGKTRETHEFLRYVTPWSLLDHENQRFIINRVDQSLLDLQLVDYDKKFASLEKDSSSVRGFLSDQKKRLDSNQKTFENAKSELRTHVLSILGVTVLGAGSVDVAFPLAKWVTGPLALGAIWWLLSSARDSQSTILTDFKERATDVKPTIGEAIQLSDKNKSEGDRVMNELLNLLARIIEHHESHTQVPKPESHQLEEKLMQLELHIIQETVLHRASSTSQNAQVQDLMVKLEKLVNEGTGKGLFGEECEHNELAKSAMEVLNRAIGVVLTAQQAQKEIDEVTKQMESQELKASADLAEKKKKENGGKLEWLYWFLLWVGITGVVLVLVMAIVAA
ncbi:hypothetical protein ALUC_50015A [Aspergillus luchuensis]|nr:hypothetical protein ALUC_50015A [Aspergillus luchuensis]